MSPAASRYTNVAIGLHWLIAVAILANLALGLFMTDMALSPQKLRFYSYHKWLGVSVFVLVLARIAWRIGHAAPPPPAGMRGWERTAAGVAHLLLYALTLAVPLTGWLFSSAKGFQTVWFGALPIPDLLGKDPLLADLLLAFHRNLNWLMAGLVVLHAGAALKHHFLARDEVLARMLPFVRRA
jgi:cytochrome b561